LGVSDNYEVGIDAQKCAIDPDFHRKLCRFIGIVAFSEIQFRQINGFP
jgi:hypothetical protein